MVIFSNMSKDFVWYNAIEADDYYDETENDFYNEI